MNERLASRHVVLLGIGHTNAHVLRMWRMQPLPDTDLTCLSNFAVATYSGMLPAVLAGQQRSDQMQIDLVRLAAVAGARLLTDRVTGIDPQRGMIELADRPPLPFDVLSIGIGSRATLAGVTVTGNSVVEIKPMQTFLDRLAAAIARTRGGPLRICVVGGGVAGTEICACLPPFLQLHTDRPWSLSLVTHSPTILPELPAATRRKVEAELRCRDVSIVAGRAVTRVDADSLELADGTTMAADVVLWATGAAPPPLLAELGLDRDRRGFLATDSTLQSTSARGIFVVGDTGSIVGQGVPKAGVHAVRQGPLLWENIQRYLDDRPLRAYRPQRSFLKLINLGDGRAVGHWRGLTFSGRWVMKLKDWIDSRFIQKYSVDADPHAAMGGDQPMPCRGCGCKLDPMSLRRGLAGVDPGEFEDAAPIGGDETPLIASTDFFAPPVDDAYLAGRIAALHTASDILACGGLPTEALANVVLPEGPAEAQQRSLQDFIAGASREFAAAGASIVGGHTIVGPRWEVGFTVIGRPLAPRPIRKGTLRPGDRLILTKPLGTGVLLAAHMRGACPSAAYQALIDSMLTSQQAIAEAAVAAGIIAGTDVTGFGLAGHLLEMLDASDVAAELWIERVPLLPAAAELVTAGIESTLAPGNLALAAQVSASPALRATAAYRLLFDPQTCGGLLFGVNASCWASWRQRVGSAYPLTEIGRVIPATSNQARLSVVSGGDSVSAQPPR